MKNHPEILTADFLFQVDLMTSKIQHLGAPAKQDSTAVLQSLSLVDKRLTHITNLFMARRKWSTTNDGGMHSNNSALVPGDDNTSTVSVLELIKSIYTIYIV
jgi:hypothetical protein